MKRGDGLHIGLAALVLIGIWMAASPWVFGYTVQAHAIQDTITGVLLIGAALLSAVLGPVTAVPLWFVVIVGLWMALTPAMFGQAGESFSADNDIVLGLLTVLVAAVALGSRARLRLFAGSADPEAASGQTSLW